MSKKLVHYGGSGIESAPGYGEFVVRFETAEGEHKEIFFDYLDEAEAFYNSLNCEKFIWDYERGELLDGMVYED